MKKTILSSIVFSGIVIFSVLPATATGGALRKASICWDRNGLAYGRHGDGHWHRAVNRSGRWYAIGSSLGFKNPCN